MKTVDLKKEIENRDNVFSKNKTPLKWLRSMEIDGRDCLTVSELAVFPDSRNRNRIGMHFTDIKCKNVREAAEKTVGESLRINCYGTEEMAAEHQKTVLEILMKNSNENFPLSVTPVCPQCFNPVKVEKSESGYYVRCDKCGIEFSNSKNENETYI